jgi:phage shock protein A
MAHRKQETHKEHRTLSHETLSDIKYDVDALKKKLHHPESQTQELILEIESLKDSVHEMNEIFKRALKEVKEDDASRTLKIITERLEAVVTQNETIAKGMVAISDKLEDFMHNQGASSIGGSVASGRHIMSAPSMPGTSRNAPLPQMSSPSFSGMGGSSLPPPPVYSDTERKKLGLFK